MEFPFERGDGAETAHLIAPLGEFDISMVGGTRHDPLCTVDQIDLRGKAALFGGEKLIDFVVIADTGKNIDLFEFLSEFLFVALRETSCHDENGVAFTSRIKVKNRIE